MLFVFPVNCGCRRVGGQPIENVIYFYMARRPPEWSLFTFVGAYMAARLSDECLKVGGGFYSISLSEGMDALMFLMRGFHVAIYFNKK